MSFVPNESLVNISRGKIAGAKPFAGYGEITTSGADSGVVWPDGAYVLPPSTGVQMSIVSSSTDDDMGGVGINSIHIHYLDSALAEQHELVELDGTTPVLTVATDIRMIQEIHVGVVGTSLVAVGTINISNGGTVYGQIPVGKNRCASSVRMVPAGKRLLVNAFYAGSSSGAAQAKTVVRISVTKFGQHDYTEDSIFIPIAAGTFQDNSNSLAIDVPFVIEEGTAIGMLFETDKAATIVASWFGWLENV